MSDRKAWLDWARATAIISVTFNHALSRSFATHSGTYEEFLLLGPFPSFIKALLYIFSRLGVPLFLMISGALLLPREYEDKPVLKRFISHNYLRLLITTEIWIFLMFWFIQLFDGSTFKEYGLPATLRRSVTSLFFIDQEAMGSMWYMSMILCVYLTIPVISLGVRKLGDKLFFALCGIAVMSGMVIPDLNAVLSALGYEKKIDFELDIADIFSIYTIYILCGYWLSRSILEKLSDMAVYSLFILCFTATALFQYWVYTVPDSNYYVRYSDIGILLAGAFLFESFRRVFGDQKNSPGPVLFLSRSALGIYFLHICVMTAMKELSDSIFDINYFLRFAFLEISTLFITIAIIWPTSKIGFVRKHLYIMK